MAETALFGLPWSSVVAAVLAGLVCGLVGTLVVLRRLVALGGGVAHAAFGGIGVAVVLGLDARFGATAVAVGAALLLAALPRRGGDRQDAVIGVLWAAGMALGMALLAGAPGAEAGVEGYLFGDIARVRGSDLLLLGAVAAALLAGHLLFGREMVATAFDPEHAQLQGVPVRSFERLQLALVALAIVALLALVGAVLAIALLAVPPLVALRFGRGLSGVVVNATAVAIFVCLAGIAVATPLGAPTGPAIVLTGTVLLLMSRAIPARRAPRAS